MENTNTMSIHQALAELKLLDKRINSVTNVVNFVSFAVGKKSVSGFKSVEEFEAYAKSAYQSVTDLIKRRDAIKAAIVHSNAVTKVRVGDEELTVADAIERKKTIVYRQALLRKLTTDLNDAVRSVDAENRNVQARLEELLKISLGTDRKGKEVEAEAISKNFKGDNEAYLVDPIGIRAVIDKLMAEIETFLTQIDYRLSESNTLTKITVG
ncbi:hypothetical protein SECTIM467_12 [Brevibacillus phage SecTim467]|uniref:Uncharacterized protein n=2 Tax=Jenstvirus jenst TaxID=1982225 RepID=A0A0K2CNV9_9CAUD|nr:tail fiber protein [Brevibacillus phage Jenst]ALA07142.1 hypothetical protein JENST_12 [Brevibacillus phage Jenst]ALA07512.1 hypothetical protein SECTIM467_12 [Brevibacillus phage SecTim467]